jgi:calcium uniporter protein, mitochondrial
MQKRPDAYTAKYKQSDADSQNAANLSQNVTQAEKDHFDRVEEESKDRQRRSPWMREGSDVPPVARNRSAGAMVKGKLLTTPSRMLKLILPLTIRDRNNDRKDVEPLALLVHPQQPLSYLERLIQSELPTMNDNGKERPPNITFRAQDSSEEDGPSQEDELENAEEIMVGGKLQKTGKLRSTSPSAAAKKADDALPAHGHGKDEPTSSVTEDPEHPHFVRWSPSTEIGDFIRDAARGKEFAVDMEGAGAPIFVGVPSFADRTYYLRMRLRKTARRISELADVKKECDEIAHRGAKRVAQGGFAALVAWWGAVYYLTFKTELGWVSQKLILLGCVKSR